MTTNPALCVNPDFPKCGHPLSAHEPVSAHEPEGNRPCWDTSRSGRGVCPCNSYVAPGTVAVTVGGKVVGEIDPPPADCEYGLFRDRWGWHIAVHLVQPPDRIVKVPMYEICVCGHVKGQHDSVILSTACQWKRCGCPGFVAPERADVEAQT